MIRIFANNQQLTITFDVDKATFLAHFWGLKSRGRRMTPFGLKLKNTRQKRGLSQRELAELLGIGARIISSAESGRGRPLTEAMIIRLGERMRLPDAETAELAQAAEVSDQTLRLPASATPIEIELMNRLVKAIKTNSWGQRQALCASLEALV